MFTSKTAHVDGTVNPARDIETIGIELIFADIDSAEKRADKYRKQSKGGDKEATFHKEVAEKVVALLTSGKPARAGDWSEDERESLTGMAE